MSDPPTYHFHWVWDLPAAAEKVWPLVSDTNRFNRDSGLPTVVDGRAQGEELENARRKLTMVVKGLPLAWEELPFEWVSPWRFGVVRRYSKGPLVEMRVRAELEPTGAESCRLTYDVAAIPRGLLGRLAAKVQIGILSRNAFGKIFLHYAEHVRDTGRAEPVPVENPVARRRLAQVGPRLAERGADPVSAYRLADHLATTDDLSLVKIRPALLSRLWELPRTDLVETCLEATRLGVLNLQWDILCPLCGGAKEDARTLSDLRSSRDVHCDTCRIDFSLEFDRSVELTFRPHPNYREPVDAMFCVAGPQVTPHILAQQLLQPGERREIRPRLQEGGHRIRPLNGVGGGGFEVVATAEPSTITVKMDLNAIQTEGPATVGIDPVIVLTNETPVEQLIVVERTQWTDDVVTAAEITANQTFRDLFSSEVLAHGEFISVGTLTIVFTDLRNSTLLYRQIGDARAYGRVMEHFEVLRTAIARERGTVVKTIGDAVMAVFTSPGAALRSMSEARAALLAAGGEDEPLVLKVGIHTGPCIAVTLNERIDYFGTSVNIAARLGDLSSGTDIVISDEVRSDPEVADLLEVSRASITVLDTGLKGIEGPKRLWRISGLDLGDSRASASRGEGPDPASGEAGEGRVSFLGMEDELEITGESFQRTEPPSAGETGPDGAAESDTPRSES